MSFYYHKIPQIREDFKNKYWSLVEFKPKDVKMNRKIPVLKFEPSSGWKGYIEKR